MPAPASHRRVGAALTAALAALAVAASPAAADSVAYVKAGDVYLSTTDGSREFRVTSDGGYSTVSQADDGRMVALRGDKIRQLARDGAVLSEIATPVSTTTDPSMQFRGPFDPEFSPNGRKVSYTYYWQYIGQDPYCNASTGCYTQRLYHGTGFTAPDRLTAWDEPGFKRRSGWIHGSWVDDETILLSDPYILPNEDTVLWSPDATDDSGLRTWYADPNNNGDVADVTISRDRSAMAQVTNSGRTLHIMTSAGGFHPNYPASCFQTSLNEGSEGKISSPTLSADGSKLFFASPDGVHVATLPRFTTNTECPTATDPGRVLTAGASNPSWGPADVPAERQVTPPPPPPQNQAPVDDPRQAPAATARLKVSAGRLKVVVRRGLTVRLTGAKAGRHTVVAKLAGRKVGSGKVTVGPTGSGKVTVRFTKAGARKLKARRTATLTIQGAGARATVKLKR